MPLLDVAELAPIRRLLAVAHGDTGQSRTVAGFLLAWWNARELRRLRPDRPLGGAAQGSARDRVATAAFAALHRSSSRSCELGPQFEQLVTRWRPALAEPGNA